MNVDSSVAMSFDPCDMTSNGEGLAVKHTTSLARLKLYKSADFYKNSRMLNAKERRNNVTKDEGITDASANIISKRHESNARRM